MHGRPRTSCGRSTSAASRGRLLPRDLSRPPSGRAGRAASTAIYYLLAPRRGLGLAPGRRGRGLAFLRRRAAGDHALAERRRKPPRIVSARISRGASGRNSSCRPATGRRADEPRAPGRSSAAPWRPAFVLRGLRDGAAAAGGRARRRPGPSMRWRSALWRNGRERSRRSCWVSRAALVNAWPSFEYQTLSKDGSCGSPRAIRSGRTRPRRSCRAPRSTTTLVDFMAAQLPLRQCAPDLPAHLPARRPRVDRSWPRGATAVEPTHGALDAVPDECTADPSVLLEPKSRCAGCGETARSYGGEKADDTILVDIVSRIRQDAVFASLDLDDRPRRLGSWRGGTRLCRALRHRRRAGAPRHRPRPSRADEPMAWGRGRGRAFRLSPGPRRQRGRAVRSTGRSAFARPIATRYQGDAGPSARGAARRTLARGRDRATISAQASPSEQRASA